MSVFALSVFTACEYPETDDSSITHYLLTIVSKGNGVVSPSEAEYLVAGGSRNICAIPNSGYRFLAWEVSAGTDVNIEDCEASSTVVTIGIDDATVTATFTPFLLGWEIRHVSDTAIVSVSASADGKHLAVATKDDDIFTSNDGGLSWADQPASGKRAWKCVISSAKGDILYAYVEGGSIYRSKDYGFSWLELASAGVRSWSDIACSASGASIVACVSEGDIFTSADSGETWTDQISIGSVPWKSVSMSADGNFLVACGVDAWTSFTSSSLTAYLYTSIDAGLSWISRPNSGRYYWEGVSLTGNGENMFVFSRTWIGYQAGLPLDYLPSILLVSYDQGGTWSAMGLDIDTSWKCLASSYNGWSLTATNDPPTVFKTSVNSGNAWTTDTSFSASCLAVSADGLMIFAGDNNGIMHIGHYK